MIECSKCQSERFIVRASGDHAQAKPCSACQPCEPGCDESGYTFGVNEYGYRVVRECRCLRTKRRAELFDRAQIPGRYAHSHFAKIEIPTDCEDMMGARSHASRFAQEFELGDLGLLFYGPTGTGKTLLTCCILRYLILQRGIACRFAEFGHLLTELRNCFNEPGRARDVIQPLVDIPVLVIDELGKGRGSEWELSVLDDLISKRYNAGRTTVLTTNYPVESKVSFDDQETLSERVGLRIYSRLMEMCKPVRLVGADYRQR